jgi:hypothetical protein
MDGLYVENAGAIFYFYQDMVVITHQTIGMYYAAKPLMSLS